MFVSTVSLIKTNFLRAFKLAVFTAVMLVVLPISGYAENESLAELNAIQKTLYQKPEGSDASVKRITRKMVAVDAITLKSARYTVHLWGVKPVADNALLLDLRAVKLLDGLIKERPVSCRVISVTDATTFDGRCLAENGEDIGLALIQKGYATVDRKVVYRTQFEDMYFQAQESAENQRQGVWGEMYELTKPSTLPSGLKSFLDDLGPIVYLLGPLFIMVLIAWIVKNGFDRVLEGQQRLVLKSQEKQDALQARERMVLAASLDAELVENRAKIEAYLNIYRELLDDLTDVSTVPKYQSAGDSIALHPTLSRTMFEGNTNKLSVLGMKLASEISRLYSNFHSETAYENLDPAMPIEQAKAIVNSSITSATELLPQIDYILQQVKAVANTTPGAEG